MNASLRVRKAVIPAAGLGTRFLPATKAQPKEMLPIVDKPTIQYVIEEALASGIDDIIIITGKDKRAIEDHFDRSPELEEVLAQRGKTFLLEQVQRITNMADIHYIRQKEPLGLGHAILCARRHIGNEPFAVLLGDDVVAFGEPCLAQMLRQYEHYRRPVIAVQRVAREEVSSYGMIAGRLVADRVYEVLDLVEKPSPEEAPSDLAIIGRYILDPTVFDLLAEVKPGVGGEIQLTDALRILNHRTRLLAYEFEGVRYDVGDKLGYLKAIVDFALMREDLGPDFWCYLNERVKDWGVSSGKGVAKGPKSLVLRGHSSVPSAF